MSKYSQKTVNGVKQSIHRHIMEAHLGRPLQSNEHVYHLNGDNRDNHVDNLTVITKKVKNG